jgi:glutamine amidotransferase
VPSGSYFYFVHSYYADPQDESVVLGTTSYGLDFCSAAAWDNVVAVQFHPEKSGDLGLRIYRQFIDLVEAQPRIGVGA